MRALVLAVFLVSVAANAQETIRGVVLDPQGRVVSGAEVELSCAGASRRVLTGGGGEFSFAASTTSATCELVVRHPGFDPWQRTLRQAGTTLTVRLTVAPLRETVLVGPLPATSRLVPSPSLSAARLTESDLHGLGPDSRLWLDFAVNAAGAFVGQTQVYVNGMAVDGAPDAAQIDSVVVNADPFSAEFGVVDENRIDVTTRDPGRNWRFNAGGPTLSRGGGDALVTGSPPERHHLFAGVSGPIPALPAAFFAQGSRFSATEQPTYLSIQAGHTGLVAAERATSTISTWSVGASVNRPGLTAQATLDASDMRLADSGVGGLTAPEAGSHGAHSARRFLSSWKVSDRKVTHRGGVLVGWDSHESLANSAGLARTIFGQVNTSGSDPLADTGRETRVQLGDVMEGAMAGRPWSAGVDVSRSVVRDSPLPNPLGRLQLDALDAARGTLVVQSGAPALLARATTAAVFLQATPIVRDRMVLRAGVRGDWEDGEGLLLSPRTTLLTTLGGFGVASSAGLFVQPLSAAFRLETVRRDSAVFPTQVVWNVPTSSAAVADTSAGEPLTLRVAPGFARRRDLVLQTSLARHVGSLDAGIEYKWTRGMALAGASRARTLAGLVDLVDSDRRLARQQWHARLGVSSPTLTVTGHYEFVRSVDDTDGAFALPAHQEDVVGEWGASTGVARHHASLVASWSLPRGIRAFVSGKAASGSPYSMVTGRDVERLATFTDRGGAPRNSLVGPATRSVSFYASRRVELPKMHGLAFDVGVRVENVFDWTNVTGVGSVIGTSWSRAPLSAGSGRSFNVWASLSR